MQKSETTVIPGSRREIFEEAFNKALDSYLESRLENKELKMNLSDLFYQAHRACLLSEMKNVKTIVDDAIDASEIGYIGYKVDLYVKELEQPE